MLKMSIGGKMRRVIFKKILATFLSAVFLLSAPVTYSMAAETVAYIDDASIVDAKVTDEPVASQEQDMGDPELSEFTEAVTSGGTAEESDTLGAVDISKIHNPVTTSSGVTTWSYVMFGKYWQGDTNGDGYCFWEDTTVTKTDDSKYYDQDGRRLYNFSGNPGTYLADEKQPIKWKVLSIDGDGNALLLSDKVLDVAEFNTVFEDTSWDKCSLRSYLNSYDEYSSEGFIDMAFSNREKEAISETTLDSTVNEPTGLSCTAQTNDKVFCLSTEDVLNGDYGFVKMEIKSKSSGTFIYTDNDPTRTARITEFVKNKPGYMPRYGSGYGRWWLRTPGSSYVYTAYVDADGSVQFPGHPVNQIDNICCVRPAIRINLAEQKAVWSQAGDGSSTGSSEVLVDQVKNPVSTGEGATMETTWHCIWFGNYWQEDTNGDGHCFSQKTIVSKGADDLYYDQNGDLLYKYHGSEVTYEADEKQPIKWRVLDLDKDGNALLLSDKLVEHCEYNKSLEDVTWERCTLRSYLNGYDDTRNDEYEDYTGKGFADTAFTADEKKAIAQSKVENTKNPVFNTSGGNDTVDRVFCLSVDEVNSGKYGFPKLEYTKGAQGDDPSCSTDYAAVFRALTTAYSKDKPGYTYLLDTGDDSHVESWRLRTPGKTLKDASIVTLWGAVMAGSVAVNKKEEFVRPAIRLNLASAKDFWSYAGTVSSDGEVNEEKPDDTVYVTGMNFDAQQTELTLQVGDSALLKPVISPSDATDQQVSWKSSDDSIVSVDDTGKVTALKAGQAVITVRTKDGGYEAVSTITVVEKETGIYPGIDVDPNAEEDRGYLTLDMIPGQIQRLIVNKNGVHVQGVRYRILSGKCITLKNGVVCAKKLKKGEDLATAVVEASYWDRTVKYTVNVHGTLPEYKAGEKDLMIGAPKAVKAVVGTDSDIVLKMPEKLAGKTVACEVIMPENLKTMTATLDADNHIFSLKAASAGQDKSQVSFTLTPKEAGGAYIRWTVGDGTDKSQAVTKVVVTKPVKDISIYNKDGLDSLDVGGGRRLIVLTTWGNTDPKPLAFKVKGKNVKCSKTGFIAVTDPGAQAQLTIKAGKMTMPATSVKAGNYTPDKYIKLNKTTVNVKSLKDSSASAAIKLKASVLPKGSETIPVSWTVDGPSGIKTAADAPGLFEVNGTVSPGSYIVHASASGYNEALCELVVR